MNKNIYKEAFDKLTISKDFKERTFSYMEECKKEKINKNKGKEDMRKIGRYGAVAAVIALVLGVGLLFNNKSDNEIKEMIVLADGKLVNLLVNNNGRMISCDNTGSWSCEGDSSLVDFSVTKSNGIIDFSSKVRPKGNIEDYSLELASHDINVAKKEITNVKRLVKKVFDK